MSLQSFLQLCNYLRNSDIVLCKITWWKLKKEQLLMIFKMHRQKISWVLPLRWSTSLLGLTFYNCGCLMEGSWINEDESWTGVMKYKLPETGALLLRYAPCSSGYRWRNCRLSQACPFLLFPDFRIQLGRSSGVCALCSPACQVLARLDSLSASVWVLNSLSVLCTHMYKWNIC